MAAAKNKELMKTEPEAPPKIEWLGMQFLVRPTEHMIINRSFPFWGPNLQFAIDHAKKTNKAEKNRAARWTHVLVHAKLIETETESRPVEVEVKEYKL